MGNKLLKPTAAAVRGLPCLHRFVLMTIAGMVPDDRGSFFASLGTVAALCGTQATNVRKIIRRYEGRPNAVTGEGMLMTGLDPGRFLYPTGSEARQGQAEACRYFFALPAEGPARPRRRPKNPAGKTDYARSVGRFPKPTPTPPQGEVSQTLPPSSSSGGGTVSETDKVGLPNLHTSVSQTDKLIGTNLNKGGAAPTPLPPEERGRPGDTPGQQTPPATWRPTPAEALRMRAIALRNAARDEDARKGEADATGGESATGDGPKTASA